MTVSNKNPVADSLILPGDEFSFDLNDGGTTPSSIQVTVKQLTDDIAWTLAGGFQPGFSGTAQKVGNVYTVTVSASSGWDKSPFTVQVDWAISGTPSTSSWSYSLATESLYPDLMQPRNPDYQGTLKVTDNGVSVRTDTGWIDLIGFTVANLGNGKVSVTNAAGLQSNLAGTSAPDVTDDSDSGYAVGSTWIDINNDNTYLATDVTVGAANWEQTNGAGGGGSGDVVGPASATDDALAVFDGTTGKLIKNSTGTIAQIAANTAKVSYTDGDLAAGWNGALIETAAITVTSDGATISLFIEKSGGGDLTCRFGNTDYTYDTTPADTVALTAGTDTVPVTTYVWLAESGGTVSLVTGTAFPATPFCAVATVLCQSAVTLQTDGALKVHAWTDHVTGADQGHIHHLSRWIRTQPATWTDGCAAGAMVVSSPDAYLSVAAGNVYQLHTHAFPALDMQTGDPIYVVNDPTTPYKRITTLDDITQDASGGTINSKHFPLIVWGSVNESSGDCKFFVNLPTGTYNSSANAELDANGYGVYAIPPAFTGCGFLIANYVVEGKTSGAWVENARLDLRGLFPSVSAGGGSGITDHGGLSGLADDDHTQYSLADGTRGGNVVGPASNVANTMPVFSGTSGKLLADSVDVKYSSGQLSLTSAGAASLRIVERASAPASAAANGDFWVKNDAPCRPMFTDDAGTDHSLGEISTFTLATRIANAGTSTYVHGSGAAPWDYSGMNATLTGAQGSPGDPTSPAGGIIVPFDGVITSVSGVVRDSTTNASTTGDIELWKWNGTSDTAISTWTGTQVGTSLYSIYTGRTTSGNWVKFSQTPALSVSAGDYIEPLAYIGTVSTTGLVWFNITITIERTA